VVSCGMRQMLKCGGVGVTTGEMRDKTAHIAVRGEGKGEGVGDRLVQSLV